MPWAFTTNIESAEVLNELWRLNDDWVVELDDAVAVYRDRHNKLRYQQNVAPTVGEEAGLGLLWGSLLGRANCCPLHRRRYCGRGRRYRGRRRLAGGAIGGVGGAVDAEWWRHDFGISDAFVKDVSKMIGPGDSAIFAWIQSNDPERIAERFRGLGGRVLRTTLTPEQSAKLDALLHSQV